MTHEVTGTEIYTWGFSRLDVPDKSSPALIGPLLGKKFCGIAAGDRHSAALTDTGDVYVWGDGDNGQLGLGADVKRVPEPVAVPELKAHTVISIASGATHTLALCEKIHWTPDKHKECPAYFRDLVKETLIANYFSECRTLTDDLMGEVIRYMLAGHELFSWGNNQYGQLGLGDTERRSIPTRIRALQGIALKQISAGGNHCAAIAGNGVVTWGRNQYGQLGHGHHKEISTPEVVEKLKGKNVVAIAAGAWHTMALVGEEVYTWGLGRDGRLGHADKSDRSTPTLVTTLRGTPVSQIAAGGAHSMALSDGAVHTWGNGEQGKLGLGNRVVSKLVPTEITTLSASKNVRLIATGGAHSIVVCKEGNVYVWGEGKDGQLGLGGDYSTYFTPKECLAMAQKNIVMMALGSWHCVVLVDDGVVQ